MLGPPPSPRSSEDGKSTEWPVEWPIYFLSIREAREKAFLQRLVPSAAAVARVFHGQIGAVLAAQKRPRRRLPQPRSLLRPGEIGCDASHRLLWQSLSVSPNPAQGFIVCEDDVDLSGNPTQVEYLRVLMQEATQLQLDLVYLAWFQGYNPRTPPKPLSEHLRVPFGEYLQLWCIYVTPVGLAKLVREFPAHINGATPPPILPIDVAVKRSRFLRSAVAWPPLAWTVGAHSDTAPA